MRVYVSVADFERVSGRPGHFVLGFTKSVGRLGGLEDVRVLALVVKQSLLAFAGVLPLGEIVGGGSVLKPSKHFRVLVLNRLHCLSLLVDAADKVVARLLAILDVGVQVLGHGLHLYFLDLLKQLSVGVLNLSNASFLHLPRLGVREWLPVVHLEGLKEARVALASGGADPNAVFVTVLTGVLLVKGGVAAAPDLPMHSLGYIY